MFKLTRDQMKYTAILAVVLFLGIASQIADGSFAKKAATSINNSFNDKREINGTTTVNDVDTIDSLNQTRIIKK